MIYLEFTVLPSQKKLQKKQNITKLYTQFTHCFLYVVMDGYKGHYMEDAILLVNIETSSWLFVHIDIYGCSLPMFYSVRMGKV